MLTAEPSVEILMATYQGESWADVQIATIVAQDYSGWRLVIRDDGSTDRTPEILRCWRDRFPSKIAIIDEHNPTNLGLSGNFSALMRASSAPYLMLASWDDVWYRDKVSSAVKGMQLLEEKHGSNRPLLIHSDLRMVDANLRELQPSVMRHRGLVPQRNRSVGRFCLENAAFGCTFIFNRPLLEVGYPIPRAAGAEDWWLALVAAAFGVVEARPEVSLDWRRHGANDSKPSKSLLGSLRSLTSSPLAHRRTLHAALLSHHALVGAFYETYRDRLSARDRATLEAFLAFPRLGFWERRRAIVKHRIFYTSWARTAGLLLLA